MKLTNPFDIFRHKEFLSNIEALKRHGFLRFYSEIAEKTAENKGNISAYVNGYKAISDNFLDRFKKAYKVELEKVRHTTYDKKHEDVSDLMHVSELIAPYNSDPSQLLKEINSKLSFLQNAMRAMERKMEKLVAENPKRTSKKAPKKKKSAKARK